MITLHQTSYKIKYAYIYNDLFSIHLSYSKIYKDYIISKHLSYICISIFSFLSILYNLQNQDTVKEKSLKNEFYLNFGGEFCGDSSVLF